MGADRNKNYLEYRGRTLLSYTLAAFAECEAVEDVVLVVKKGEEDYAARAVEESGIKKPVTVAEGGSSRQQSVLNGLRCLGKDTDTVAIHDGARILITPGDIGAAVERAFETGASALAGRVTDTVAVVNASGSIGGYEDRDRLCFMQTPQCFGLEAILRAHEEALKEGFSATDDTSVYLRYVGDVSIVYARNENMKVTRPEDLPLAQSILGKREKDAE